MWAPGSRTKLRHASETAGGSPEPCRRLELAVASTNGSMSVIAMFRQLPETTALGRDLEYYPAAWIPVDMALSVATKPSHSIKVAGSVHNQSTVWERAVGSSCESMQHCLLA